MSKEPEQLEDALQHEADRVRPVSGKANVMTYLVVLFGAAFLLLLMTYFMQQRTSQETIDGLKQSMTTMTTLKSIEELQAENAALQDQVDDLTFQLATLQSQLSTAEQQQAALTEETQRQTVQNTALNYLNQIRALYNQRKNNQAREVLVQADAALQAQGGMEGVLSSISVSMTQEERDIYDPLEAFQSIIEWLN